MVVQFWENGKRLCHSPPPHMKLLCSFHSHQVAPSCPNSCGVRVSLNILDLWLPEDFCVLSDEHGSRNWWFTVVPFLDCVSHEHLYSLGI